MGSGEAKMTWLTLKNGWNRKAVEYKEYEKCYLLKWQKSEKQYKKEGLLFGNVFNVKKRQLKTER